MQTSRGSSSRRRPWVLLLGPCDRLSSLPALLASVPGAMEGRPDSIRALEDMGELFCDFPPHGRIVFDSDRLPIEQTGLLAAFLERHPGWELALCGTDPSAAPARRLLRSPRARWFPWPLDLEELALLARFDRPFDVETLEPRPAHEESPRPADRAADGPEGRRVPGSGSGLAPALREEIERILGRTDPTSLAEEAAESSPTPSSAPSPESASAPAPPAYFRDQIADLADIAQRLELAAGIAREQALGDGPGRAKAAPDLAQSLEDLDLETLRLAQFTRTLGFLAAPPPRGDQRIELAAMIEEMLSSFGREARAPRYFFRSAAPLWVRADKSLLAQALDAMIYLSHACAGPGGAVRVAGALEPSNNGSAAVELSLTFPAGPLDGTPPERVLEPYALRRAIPELGPNALAAARGILRGQGGTLQLARVDEGSLKWILILPAVEPASE